MNGLCLFIIGFIRSINITDTPVENTSDIAKLPAKVSSPVIIRYKNEARINLINTGIWLALFTFLIIMYAPINVEMHIR